MKMLEFLPMARAQVVVGKVLLARRGLILVAE
jgi:hypothetical protein